MKLNPSGTVPRHISEIFTQSSENGEESKVSKSPLPLYKYKMNKLFIILINYIFGWSLVHLLGLVVGFYKVKGDISMQK